MKSAERPRQQVVLWRPREENAFLPAALEIVETPPSPLGRATAATIIAFFVLALGWAFLGHVDIIATAPGRLIPVGEVKVIQPLDAGIVRAIHVEDGAQVVLLPVPSGVLHIGRSTSAGLTLDDATVSRRHAVIVRDRDGTRILDDRSLNGVVVRGVRVSNAHLRDGDVIQLGRVRLHYLRRA